MSPLGKLLFSLCDENVSVNMSEHWRQFYLAGFHKNHVEMHAAKIGVKIVHITVPVRVDTKIIDSIPISRYDTIIGIPIPRVAR